MTLPPYLEKALNYLDIYCEHQNIALTKNPGFVVGVSYKGEMVYKKAWGYANLETKEKMIPDHLFRVASHSKTFTATAIMQLVEKGKLKLDDCACEYSPFLKENPDQRYQTITIRQLLSHSAGIARDGGHPFWSLMDDFPNREEIETFFKTQPLAIEPNTRFKYSNFGYGLLGWVIEKCSGQSYQDYMKDHIIKPLGLKNIAAEHEEGKQYAIGYMDINLQGEQTPIDPAFDTGDARGAMGFYADVEGLCGFYQAVMKGSGKLLTDDSKNEMFKQHWPVPDDVKTRYYGLGFDIDEKRERQFLGHGGGMPGHLTRTRFDQAEELVVSVFSNSLGYSAADFINIGIWSILDFFKKHDQLETSFPSYQGTFYNIWTPMSLVPLGDSIYVGYPEETEPFINAGRLEHIEGNKFRVVKENGYGFYGEVVEFVKGDDKIQKILYGGMPFLNRDDFLVHCENLKKQFV